MSRLFRGFFIVWTVLRFGLDELVLSSFKNPWIRLLKRIVCLGRNLNAPRGERLRLALERLGPIFVKFGQVMSTRRDLLPLVALLSLSFLLGNLALQYGAARLAAHTTALVMLSEVLFASVSSVLLGASSWDSRTLIGGALILLAALLSIVGPGHKAK